MRRLSMGRAPFGKLAVVNVICAGAIGIVRADALLSDSPRWGKQAKSMRMRGTHGIRSYWHVCVLSVREGRGSAKVA